MNYIKTARAVSASLDLNLDLFNAKPFKFTNISKVVLLFVTCYLLPTDVINYRLLNRLRSFECNFIPPSSLQHKVEQSVKFGLYNLLFLSNPMVDCATGFIAI